MVFTRMMNARDKLMQFNLLLAGRDLNAEAVTDWLAGLALSCVISTSKLLYPKNGSCKEPITAANRQMILVRNGMNPSTCY